MRQLISIFAWVAQKRLVENVFLPRYVDVRSRYIFF